MSNEIKVSGAVSLAEKDRKLMADLLAALSKGGKKPPAADEDDGTGDDTGDDTGDGVDDFEGGGDDDGGDDTGGDDAGPELTDVAEAMKNYATAKGPGGAGSKALAMKVLKAKGGVDALSKLKPAKFVAVIDACKAAQAALKKKK